MKSYFTDFFNFVELRQMIKERRNKYLLLILAVPLLMLIDCFRYLDRPSCELVRNSSMIILMIALFYFLIMIIVATFFLFAGLVSRRERSKFILRSICILASCSFVFGVLRFNGYIQGLALVRASTNGSEIVRALQEYKEAKGSYPNTLSLLVPSYLPRLPSTQMCSSPLFKYIKSKNEADYSLMVHVGPFFETLMYSPKMSYENALKRYGDWAYYSD